MHAGMNVPWMWVTVAVLAGAELARAAEETKPDRPAHPIAQHVEEMQALWSQQGGTLRGDVKFVYGNDLWQPGRQFANGRDWLALACSAKGCTLQPATLGVSEKSWQGHYDDQPTEGQQLTFKLESGAGTAVAWFNTAAAPGWLKPGPVVTYHSPALAIRPPLGPGTMEAAVAAPGGDAAVLVPMLLTADMVSKFAPGARNDTAVVLQLRERGQRQLLLGQLSTCSTLPDPRHYLPWAGDLDRDGKTDYLISFIDADGPVHLYLSSAAKSGRLVGLAGAYMAPPFGGECDGGPIWSDGW